MASKLDLYRVFSKVAQCGSISRAAKDLYMSQSAVSQAVMQLEGELETRLFHRTPKGVTLTAEGSLMYEHAHSALSFIEAGEQKLLEFKNVAMGELKIGVGDTISRYFLLPYLARFRSRYPNITFKIVNGTTLEICSILKSGEVDIGLCNFPLHEPALERIACLEVEDIFVCSPRYQAAGSAPVALEDIARMPLILLERGSNSRNYVEDYLLSQGVNMTPEFELGSHDLLLEFVRMNFGVACVTKQFSQEYLRQGYVVEIPLITPIPKRQIGVCYLKSVPLSPAATRFVELLLGDS